MAVSALAPPAAAPAAAAPAAVAAPSVAAQVAVGSTNLTAGAQTSSPPACADTAYNLTGPRWDETLQWSFNAASTPTRLSRTAVVDALKRAFSNVTNANNDCGLGVTLSASASYVGPTTRSAKCTSHDGHNVISFRDLPSGTMARTCWWSIGGRLVEADIQINKSKAWALSTGSCNRQPLLEATMTHEVGHAFGLGHVTESDHGRLTMSPVLDGLCNNAESTLGLGDILGLKQLY
ncbi:MAG TPA: matrixin family metalloprotease [Candidatus Limnocylindria bacterium]|nr:matrixin family metalloprotease [Candidatus Limnocylindria bacterium]